MNQEIKIINVELKKENESDILSFFIEEEEHQVSLNSENSQNDLKEIFSILLGQMTNNPIELNFQIAQDYKSGLFIDVCSEYIKELNREIKQVIKKIPQKSVTS